MDYGFIDNESDGGVILGSRSAVEELVAMMALYRLVADFFVAEGTMSIGANCAYRGSGAIPAFPGSSFNALPTAIAEEDFSLRIFHDCLEPSSLISLIISACGADLPSGCHLA